MDLNEKYIFFAGGKKFDVDSSDKKSSITMAKTAEGFSIQLNFTIAKEEAELSIYNFNEIEFDGDGKPKKANLVYLEAYDDKNNPKKIIPSEASVMLAYDKEGFSEINLKLFVANSGKTDHPKTEHPVIN